ncbi:hypothetical protein CRYUN_Cryun26dG0080600 [Craigia yunnanensis]
MVMDVYGEPGEEYQIEGSFPLSQRCCTICSTSLESSSKPGVDCAFAMRLMLILHQIFDDKNVDPGTGVEDSFS